MKRGIWYRRLLATTSTLGLAVAGMIAPVHLAQGATLGITNVGIITGAGATGISLSASNPPNTGTISALAEVAPPGPITYSDVDASPTSAIAVGMAFIGSTLSGGAGNVGVITAVALTSGTLTVGTAETAATDNELTLMAKAGGFISNPTVSFAGGFDNGNTISASATLTIAIDFLNGAGNHVAAVASATSVGFNTSAFSGGITNSGSLTASASATTVVTGNAGENSITDTALAQGIVVTGSGIGSTFAGGMINFAGGTVTASATANASTGVAQAAGIVIGNESFSGGIINEGTVRASALGHGASATGFRLTQNSGFAGGILNTGTIGATAVGASAEAYGIRVVSGVGPGTIYNSGTISASGGAGSAAIDLRNATTGTVVDQAAGAIIGNIDFSTHADSIVVTGGVIDGSIVGNPGTSTYASDGQSVTASGTATFGCSGLAPAGCASITDVEAVTVDSGTLFLTPSVRLSSIGTFSQSTGSTLVLEVYAPGVGPTYSAAPSITANVVKLAGVLEIDPLAPPATVAADQYLSKNTYANIIVANGGTDSDKLKSLTSNTPLLTPKLTDKKGDYTLTLTRVAFGNVAGLSKAERSFGNSLETLYDKGQDLAAIDPLFGMTAAQYLAYMKSGSAPASVVTKNQAVQSTQTFTTAIQNRLQSQGAFDGSGFSLGLGETEAPDTPRSGGALAGFASDGGNAGGHWGLWSHAYGLSGDGTVGMGGAGFSQTAGGIIGYDAKIAPRLVVGVAADYVRAAWDFDQGIGNDRQGQYQVSAYGRYAAGAWHLSGIAGAGYADYDGAGGAATSGLAGAQGALSGNDILAYGELGYDVKRPGLTLTPLAGLGFTRWHVNGSSDSGFGAADLTTGSSNASSLASSVGGRVATEFELAGAHLASTFQLVWQHALASDNGVVTERFAGAAAGPGFTQPGTAFAGDSAVVGLGLTGALSASTRLFVDYDGTYNRTYPNQSVSAGFRASF